MERCRNIDGLLLVWWVVMCDDIIIIEYDHIPLFSYSRIHVFTYPGDMTVKLIPLSLYAHSPLSESKYPYSDSAQ